jgi:hypothetical protein
MSSLKTRILKPNSLSKMGRLFKEEPISQPQLVKKFYFLEYFYILLKSAETNSDKTIIFERFKDLKHKFQLGESKYKKLTQEYDSLSEVQIGRYYYTFEQVISESIAYGLITEKDNEIKIKDFGSKVLKSFSRSKKDFNKVILQLMEKKYNAFYHLVNLTYKVNRHKQGLLVLPVYSPLKLGFEKDQLKKIKNIIQYINDLTLKLESDVKEYAGETLSFREAERTLINDLIQGGIISSDIESDFEMRGYYSLLKKIRSYWLNYFLNSIYGYTYSFDTFNIWVERGKQLGILHSTEFYPGIDGRVVYPTSIITKDKISNEDFFKMYEYENGNSLYVHNLQLGETRMEMFVEALVESYFDQRKVSGSLFINLSDLREKVCFKLRIPSYSFEECLQETYRLNIRGKLQIQISLEADRLPQETNALYLKREPILVNGKYKNIIAIDYKDKRK